MNRGLLLVVTSLLCSTGCRREPARVRLTLPEGISASRLKWSPSDAMISVVNEPSGTVVFVARAAQRVRFEHPELCPLEVSTVAGAITEATAFSWLSAPQELPQIGFGQTAHVVVTAGCPEARAGTITWLETEGNLQRLDVQSDGFVLHATLEPLEDARHQATPHAEIIPISFAHRGSHQLVGSWKGEGHAPVELRVRLNASTRVSGLPNVSVGQVVYLEGAKWSVLERPAGAAERVEPIGEGETGATLFQANRPGRWVLQHATRRAPFSLQVATFASTPLDCGRSGCHAAAAEAFNDNPMLHAFEHRMQQAPAASACWLGCHVVGEKGLRDEGFFDVARSFGDPGALTTPLPRALARTTGVQCLNCHGSGRIPEPSARWVVLQVGVCATCHDAPPRYGHVKAWQASAMSRSDVVQANRETGCASCHTTAGFLGRPAPPAKDAPPLGITCSACHAPHSAHGPRLLRQLPLTSVLAEVKTDATTQLCAQCHAPKSVTQTPESTAAAIVLGRGAVSSTDGLPVVAKSASHASLEGGCLACHSHSSEKVERGATHGFEARVEDCATCHANRGLLAPDTSVKTRDRFLSALSVPFTTHSKGNSPVDLTKRAGRLKWNSALLLHDRAAWAHNPAYADAVLREIISGTGK